MDYEDLDDRLSVAGAEWQVCSLYLLGPLRVVREGRKVEGAWRRKALELLAYLAVHPRGAARDQILEALWPEGDPRQTQQYLWHSVSRLRNRLQGGDASLQIVSKVDDMYRLDFERVWVDVAEFHRALLKAKGAEDAREPLESACDIYKGDFCEGRYFGWATLVRERLRSQFIEASRTLAERLEQGEELEGALIVLDRGLTSDPYDEELTRSAMKIEGRLNRRDLIVGRFRRLRRLMLEDLDVEPSAQTQALLEQLTLESRRC